MDSWTPILAFERFSLLERTWSLERDGAVLAPQLRLRPDRRVACCPLADVSGWDVADDTLLLLDRAGAAAFVFDEAGTDADGRTVLTGTRDGEDAPVTLREVPRLEQWPARADRHVAVARTAAPGRRHLLVIPAAAYARWDMGARNFDLCLLDGDDDAPADAAAEYEAEPTGPNRWAALHTLFFPGSPLLGHDLVAIAGPETTWSDAALDAAFAAAHAHDLLLAHPAVADAPAGPLRPAAGRRLGFATPLAADCPIFSLEALTACAPTFSLAPEGDLPSLWTALLGAPLARLAVIDGIAPLETAAPPPAPPDGALLARYGLAPAAFDAGTLHDGPLVA